MDYYRTDSMTDHVLNGSDSFNDDEYYQHPKDPDRRTQIVPTTPPQLHDPPVVQRKRFSFSTLGCLKQDMKITTHQSALFPASLTYSKNNQLSTRPRASFQSYGKWEVGPFSYDPQDLDLPLDDDLWMPSEQVTDVSMALMELKANISKPSTVETGMLFPWMADAEIV